MLLDLRHEHRINLEVLSEAKKDRIRNGDESGLNPSLTPSQVRGWLFVYPKETQTDKIHKYVYIILIYIHFTYLSQLCIFLCFIFNLNDIYLYFTSL